MTIGECIKEQRRNYGLTQKQLAEKMGVAEITIRQYELGKRIPSLDALQKIADAIEMSVHDLIPPGRNDIIKSEDDKKPTKALTFNATPDPEYAALEKKLEDGTITQNELQRYKELIAQGAANAHKAVAAAMKKLQGYMDALNDEGQAKVYSHASDYAKELTEIPKYQRQELPAATSDCTDTSNSEDASTEP